MTAVKRLHIDSLSLQRLWDEHISTRQPVSIAAKPPARPMGPALHIGFLLHHDVSRTACACRAAGHRRPFAGSRLEGEPPVDRQLPQKRGRTHCKPLRPATFPQLRTGQPSLRATRYSTGRRSSGHRGPGRWPGLRQRSQSERHLRRRHRCGIAWGQRLLPVHPAPAARSRLHSCRHGGAADVARHGLPAQASAAG